MCTWTSLHLYKTTPNLSLYVRSNHHYAIQSKYHLCTVLCSDNIDFFNNWYNFKSFNHFLDAPLGGFHLLTQ